MAGPGKRAIEGQNEASSSRVRTGLSTVNSTASSIKRGRSRTRNIALSKRRNANEKLLIEIPEEVNRIVGVNSQFAITEAGCLTRRFAPLQVTKWAKIDEDKKQALLRDFKGSFNSGESLRCDDVIFSQMKTHYRNYRHRLYKNFFLKEITPEHVDPEDWEYLCNYFATEEFQRISPRNKENRAVQDTQHINGAKSFARTCREREEKKGDIVGPIELYKLTRYKVHEEGAEEGSWVSETAKENYEKMVKLLNEKQLAGENEVDEEQICVEVLGYKSGYIRGRGAGPKPNRSSRKSYREELDKTNRNLIERATKAEQQAQEFSEKLENQSAVIEELKEGLFATQIAMKESQKCTSELMAFFEQFHYQKSQFPSTSPRFPMKLAHSQQSIHTSAHGFSAQKIQSSSNGFDVFANEPGLRELLREVGKC